MYFSKTELAIIQIERAIDLFIDERDFVSTLTLAGAAEEMLGNILHANGMENILAELHPWFQEKYDSDASFGQFARKANEIRNELKHGHSFPDLEHKVEVSEPLAAQMLMRALVNYKNFDLEPTVKMWKFVSWLKEREEEIFSNW
ncbi:hypothetical protein HII17_13370 [Thalassotalea sp. M1531]|uniref:DUF4145 domain-containing protein n=1 Tax=Thalassotalea algicola TaxID=2716224 RepID=A0A7Y0LDI0_9GAMM|nr:hypothetical protein [Thalassotalea algicola]NMP32550.1 hypothetical protein [Thalassotalea algicola]